MNSLLSGSYAMGDPQSHNTLPIPERRAIRGLLDSVSLSRFSSSAGVVQCGCMRSGTAPAWRPQRGYSKWMRVVV